MEFTIHNIKQFRCCLRVSHSGYNPDQIFSDRLYFDFENYCVLATDGFQAIKSPIVKIDIDKNPPIDTSCCIKFDSLKLNVNVAALRFDTDEKVVKLIDSNGVVVGDWGFSVDDNTEMVETINRIFQPSEYNSANTSPRLNIGEMQKVFRGCNTSAKMESLDNRNYFYDFTYGCEGIEYMITGYDDD